MNRPRHMAPPRPVRRVAVLLTVWVVLFAGVMTAMACQPVDGECGGETDCSEAGQ